MKEKSKVAVAILDALKEQVATSPQMLTYAQCENATRILAAKLLDSFGHEQVKNFRYTTIPRGGFFVLGMLSYLLNLPTQAFQDGTDETPLVVVDDCSRSGARFHRFLDTLNSSTIIFAHLYSSPKLRAAILEKESRVIACLAAHDLRDLAVDYYPDPQERKAWRVRWLARHPGACYWLSASESVIFPWNEPDKPVWNPIREEFEPSWWLASPDRCLKNWSRLALAPRPDIHPSWRHPDHVAHRLLHEQVMLYNLKSEKMYTLDGVSAEVWRAIVAYGDLQVVAQYLQSQYEIDDASLQNDLHALVESLQKEGLLERIEEPPYV